MSFCCLRQVAYVRSLTYDLLTMTTTGTMTVGVLEGMAKRVAAVRAELSEAERTKHPSRRALRKDLVQLETRLADALEAVA